MEGLALTGAWVDPAKGLVSVIVLEMGGSSDLCVALKPGEPVVLMGPTGAATETPGGETVLLAGGGLGNAVLFSIGQALRHAGSRVLYFAGYRKAIDRYKMAEIEAAADQVVWCVDSGEPLSVHRDRRTRAFVGNIVEAMAAYAAGALGERLDPARRDRPHHRHRLGRDDARGGRGAPLGAGSAISNRSTRPSARSTRPCNA